MTTFFAVTSQGRKRIRGARSVEAAVQKAREEGIEPKRIDVVETTTAAVPPVEPAPAPAPRMSLEDALRAAGWVQAS